MIKSHKIKLLTLIMAGFMVAGCSSTKEDTSSKESKEKTEQKETAKKESNKKDETSSENKEEKTEATESTASAKTESTTTTKSKASGTTASKSNTGNTQKQTTTSKPATSNSSGSTQSNQSNNSGYKPGLNEKGELVVQDDPDSYIDLEGNWAYGGSVEIPKEWADNPDFWE